MKKWRTDTPVQDLTRLQVELLKLKKQQVESTIRRLTRILENEAKKS